MLSWSTNPGTFSSGPYIGAKGERRGDIDQYARFPECSGSSSLIRKATYDSLFGDQIFLHQGARYIVA